MFLNTNDVSHIINNLRSLRKTVPERSEEFYAFGKFFAHYLADGQAGRRTALERMKTGRNMLTRNAHSFYAEMQNAMIFSNVVFISLMGPENCATNLHHAS
jgi:hypothetical protein